MTGAAKVAAAGESGAGEVLTSDDTCAVHPGPWIRTAAPEAKPAFALVRTDRMPDPIPGYSREPEVRPLA